MIEVLEVLPFAPDLAETKVAIDRYQLLVASNVDPVIPSSVFQFHGEGSGLAKPKYGLHLEELGHEVVELLPLLSSKWHLYLVIAWKQVPVSRTVTPFSNYTFVSHGRQFLFPGM